MQRPVELRPEMDEDEHESPINEPSDSEAFESNTTSQASGQGTAGDENGAEFTNESEYDLANDSRLRSVTFGALVEAQEKLQPKTRKRKLSTDFEGHRTTKEAEHEQPKDVHIERRPLGKPPARQSKHAPTVLSSKHQVSRRRDVFETPASMKARDPRFDPTVQAFNHDRNAIDKANKNYSFLTAYQAGEVLELKSQIQKTRDPDAVADLKHRVMGIENKIRAVEAKQRERDVANQHKQKEKDMIRTGKKSKPYYLKPGTVRKLAESERLEGMGKKARDKALERKRKREKTKEARHMPRIRRV